MRNPTRVPVRIRDAELEHCCYCNQQTTSGIYVRVDPDTVLHPTTR